MNKDNIKLYIPLKVITLLIVGLSIIYYIYVYITNDFNLNNDFNLLNTILIISITLFLCLGIISYNKKSIIILILTYILLICFVGINIYNVTMNIEKEEYNECVGSNEENDNIKINITYKKDKINKLEITYYYNEELKDKAEELSNKFDKTFKDYKNIYSEILINDNIELKYIYNFKDINISKLKILNTNINDYINEDYISYELLKEKELNKLVCKKRD